MLLGLTVDDAIKAFFGGNAAVSIVVLTLITIFLAREGVGFFGQNRDNLRIYRQAGLEYVDIIRAQQEDHTALMRYLQDLRLRQFNYLTAEKKLSLDATNEALAKFDDFSNQFSDAIEPMRTIVSDLSEVATAIKTKFIMTLNQGEERRQLLDVGRVADAGKVKIDEVNFAAELKPLLGT